MAEFITARIYDIHDAEREIKQLKEENIRLARLLSDQNQFFQGLSVHVHAVETDLARTKSELASLRLKGEETEADDSHGKEEKKGAHQQMSSRLIDENSRLNRLVAEQRQLFDMMSAQVGMLERELIKTKQDVVEMKRKGADYVARFKLTTGGGDFAFSSSPPSSPPPPSTPFLPFSSTVVPSVMAEQRGRRAEPAPPRPSSSQAPVPSGFPATVNLDEERAAAAAFADEGDDAALMQFLAREHGMAAPPPATTPSPPPPSLRVGPVPGGHPLRGGEEEKSKKKEEDDPFGFLDSW